MREVRMTFGEHLEELRRRIFIALLWLALAVAMSFVYGKGLLKWTMGPHEVAIRGAIREHSIAILESKGKELCSLISGEPAGSFARWAQSAQGAVVWDGLFAAELRRTRRAELLLETIRRVFPEWEPGRQDLFARGLGEAMAAESAPDVLPVGARSLPERFKALEEDLRRIARRPSASPVKRFLGVGRSLEDAIGPLAEFNKFLAARREAALEAGVRATAEGLGPELVLALEAVHDDMRARARTIAEDEPKPPIAISYLESFMTYFKVALVFGLFFSTPLILYEMWKFVGAGLYPSEQRYVLIFLPLSLALFFGGALFGYFTVIPVALEFLAGWGTGLVELSFTISNYVGLFFTLTVLLGLVFQTPLVMTFLGKIGVVGAAGFRKARKWALLGSVVFAAIVTPPDPLSWLLVAAPMVLLYEAGILIVAVSGGKKVPRAAEKQPLATST